MGDARWGVRNHRARLQPARDVICDAQNRIIEALFVMKQIQAYPQPEAGLTPVLVELIEAPEALLRDVRGRFA
jgi:hypothetical protein